MVQNLFQKSLNLLLRRQTNILSAAFIIMATVIFSQILGLVRERLLASIFGPSNELGIYFYASQLPDTIFQLTIAAALSSAFIPVFTEYLTKNKEQEGHQMASTLLTGGLIIFSAISLVLFIFATFFLQIFNLGKEFSPQQMALMADMMRIILVGQLLFIVGTFFQSLLQSYNHFFVPGLAAAMYNLGIIIGIVLFYPFVGIYAAPIGVVLGSFIFIMAQLPQAKKIGFSFHPAKAFIKSEGAMRILQLMWPRTISIVIFQLGTLAIASLISYLSDPGRNNVIFNFAKTLAFAPVALFGQTIAQAAFPILSKERDRPEDFKVTFITSFNQMLYLVLPISILILILRVPIVRLVFGADKFDWEATRLTGKTLAFFSVSIFAQALVTLVLRAFYALHDTVVPLLVGAFSTMIMIVLAWIFIFVLHLNVVSIAISYSIGSIIQLVILLIILDKKVGGLDKRTEFLSLLKFFFATLFTGFALYIPFKLLDQLVIETKYTVGLIILTAISSFAGLSLYLFLTWLFNVKEASMFILLFKKVGNWREILEKSNEPIDKTHFNQ